jgi:hypothetical protein
VVDVVWVAAATGRALFHLKRKRAGTTRPERPAQ